MFILEYKIHSVYVCVFSVYALRACELDIWGMIFMEFYKEFQNTMNDIIVITINSWEYTSFIDYVNFIIIP
jgi:hypothetical protein